MPVFLTGKIPQTLPWVSGPDTPDYKYSYPRNRNYEPGSEEHEELRMAILERARGSANVMSPRQQSWSEIDRVLKVYTRVDFHEELINTASSATPDRYGYFDTDKKRSKLVLPVSYANMQILLTYMSAAFLQRPYFRYKGFGPEDIVAAKIMEAVIQQQADRYSWGLNLHTHWRDGFAYGIGPIATRWRHDRGYQTIREDFGVQSLISNLFIKTGTKRKRKRRFLSEGNEFINPDPYLFLPDPSVAVSDFQEGEFVMFIERTTLSKVLSMENNERGFFNVKYDKHISGRSILCTMDKNREDWKLGDRKISANNPLDRLWAFITIIPDQFPSVENPVGVGSVPEKWRFILDGDQVIVSAMPLGLNHEKYPITVCAPNHDGHSVSPISHIEAIQDIQTLIDLLFASHIDNVRTAVNNQFIYDPLMVNTKDINNPAPGKRIRLNEPAFGKGLIDKVFKQIPVNDVTRGNVADADYLIGLMRNSVAGSDGATGQIVNRGPRISAAQFTGSRITGLSRIGMAAEIISLQSHNELARMVAEHTQQFMKNETFIEVTQGLIAALENDFGKFGRRIKNQRLSVHPLDLIINYDLEAGDANVPGTEDVEGLFSLLTMAMQNPVLMQDVNITKMFKHIARQLGVKNIDQFMNAPEVKGNEEVLQQVDKGDLVETVGGDGQL